MYARVCVCVCDLLGSDSFQTSAVYLVRSLSPEQRKSIRRSYGEWKPETHVRNSLNKNTQNVRRTSKEVANITQLFYQPLHIYKIYTLKH